MPLQGKFSEGMICEASHSYRAHLASIVLEKYTQSDQEMLIVAGTASSMWALSKIPAL